MILIYVDLEKEFSLAITCDGYPLISCLSLMTLPVHSTWDDFFLY